MAVWRAACVVLGVMVVPTAASARLIPFTVGGRVAVEPGHPVLADIGFAPPPPGPYLAFDPAAPATVAVAFLDFNLPVLPSDPPNAPNQGGGTYYQAAYITTTVTLTDLNSGASADVAFGGRVHAEWSYYGDNKWFGSAYLWSDGQPQTLTLGGNEYTLWVPMSQGSGGGQLDVWVGPDAPVSATPEPGTLALAALGLVPVGLNFVRRKRG